MPNYFGVILHIVGYFYGFRDCSTYEGKTVKLSLYII